MDSTELKNISLDVIQNTLVDGIESGLLSEAETKLTNHFAKDVYARELFIPKGSVLVGKMHRYECINIMLSGDITVYSNGETKRIDKPFIAVSPPGTKRAGYAHKDTRWVCIHGTKETQLDKIEKEFIADDENDVIMLDEIRRIRGSL